MTKGKLTCIAVIYALSAAGIFGSIESVAAKPKPTYKEAYALCKKQMPGHLSSHHPHGLYAAGSDCMLKYGYRL